MMLVYPQLSSGALTQYPTRKRRHVRTIVNSVADGTQVKLADAGAESVEWQLQYRGLSDAEMEALLLFHAAAEGTLHSFTFVDPTANLLSASGNLAGDNWDCGPLLSAVRGVADPGNGTNAWRLVNPGASGQQISQSVTGPGTYVYCFSVFARAESESIVTLHIGSNVAAFTCGPNWRRLFCAGPGGAGAESLSFAIGIEAGAVVEVYGPQAEAQARPSKYKASIEGGCYPGSRFRDDSVFFTSTGVNCHNATVNIIHASYL
jgi:hypothetical protein